MDKNEINNLKEGGISAISPEEAIKDAERKAKFKEAKKKEYLKENVYGNMEYPEELDN